MNFLFIIGGILKAYSRFHGTTTHSLVVGGKNCERFRQDYCIPEDGYGKDIRFSGYIAQEDLPAVYSLADLYLYPSSMEAFPSRSPKPWPAAPRS